MNFLGIDHVVLRVRDLERSIAFWRDVLGCPVEKVQAELGLVHIRVGHALLDLVDVNGELGRKGGAPPGPEARNMDHVCFQVSPFDAAAIQAHLAARGVACEPPKQRFGSVGYGNSIYLSDPDGNAIELRGGASSP